MSTALPPSLADFCGVLSETKRIINAHSRHFLALSVLFLLPLSFSLSVFPTLLGSFSSSSGHQPFPIYTLVRLPSSSFPPPHRQAHYHHHHFHLGVPLKTLIFLLVFSASALVFSLAAAASVTYSVFHGFYGRPVKLAPAVSSLFRSFLPLLATSAAGLLCLSVVFAAFALCQFLAWKGIELIGGAAPQSPTDSPYFMAISFVGALILAIVLTTLAVNWILVSAIVVIENRWGFDALIRSKNLVSRMRRTGLSLISFFGVTATLLILISLVSSDGDLDGSGGGVSIGVFSSPGAGDGDGWRNWAFVVQIVVTSATLTVVLLNGIAANTVFYMYCKAVSGELEDDIAKEIANEYVNLPFDDDKDPHLVSVAHH